MFCHGRHTLPKDCVCLLYCSYLIWEVARQKKKGGNRHARHTCGDFTVAMANSHYEPSC